MDIGPWDDPFTTSWWQREFTDGVDPEYTDQILPLVEQELAGSGLVLDVGTGEGQVARRLAERGAEVVGIDPSAPQVATAVERAGGPRYLRAGLSGLPFADASFDAVVACLVFEHVDALDEALAEVARVLAPGGTFLLLLNHPLLQTPGSGWIDDQILDPPEQYWRVGPYLPEAVTVEEVQKGVYVRFCHRPLSRYLNGLVSVGLTLTKMIEPSPPPAFLAQDPTYADAATIPRLLAVKTTRTEPSGWHTVAGR